VIALPRHFLVAPGAAPAAIDSAEAALGCNLPPGLRAFYAQTNGGEGFVGGSYFRAYPVERLPALHQAFGVAELVPELRIFGSNGGGEAFGFILGGAPRFVQLPFIPMVLEYAYELGSTLNELLAALRGESADDLRPDPQMVGMEVHAIHPVVFGGDPVTPANKMAVTTETYAQLVVWWNRKYREVAGRA
jgi:hypothetical protein